MISDKQLLQIVLGVQVALFAAVGYLFFTGWGKGPSNLSQGTQSVYTQQEQEALSRVTVGNSPVAYTGTILAIQADSLRIQTQDGPVAFLLGADTAYATVGEQKSSVTLNQEMQAYSKRVEELMKDPLKNAEELRNANPPTPFTEKQISLADLKVGDSVAVNPGSKNSGGSYQATKVVKINVSQ